MQRSGWLRTVAVVLVGGLGVACRSSSSGSEATPAPVPSASASPGASAAASAMAADTVDAAAVAVVDAGAPTPVATHAVTPTPTPPAPTPVTSGSGAPAPSPSPSPATPRLRASASHLGSPRWSIDFATAGCAVGDDCVATLRLGALGEYHVNADYRFRFLPSAAAGLVYTAGGPGDFARDGQTKGTMTVHFKTTNAGPVTLSGTFKICVCTDSVCAPEAVDVSLTVPAA